MMSDDLIGQVETLVDLGVGDSARLTSIIDQIKQGKKLYSSDQIYVDNLISKFLFPRESNREKTIEHASEHYEDESFKILKNRLAKGEITSQEFDDLKKKIVETNPVTDIKNEIRNVSETMEKIQEKQKETQILQRKIKSESTALVLSIILGLFGIQGIGHIYVGKVGKGVGILIGSFILFAAGIATVFVGIGIVLLIIYFVVYIWQIIDSRNLCRKYNDELEDTGEPPW